MNNIADLRRIRGLTQTELADLVGVSQPHISRVEKGDEGPSLSVFRKIAKALDVELSDLFSEGRSASEKLILEVFRELPPERQQGWIEMAKVVLSSPDPEGDRTSGAADRSSEQ